MRNQRCQWCRSIVWDAVDNYVQCGSYTWHRDCAEHCQAALEEALAAPGGGGQE